MIQENVIAEWSSIVPWSSPDHVEQDLIISRALVEIYCHATLKQKLAFRGGTALNKNHLSRPYRYSEDLDFVQVTPEGIGDTFDIVEAYVRIMKDIAPLLSGDSWKGLRDFLCNKSLSI